MKAITIYQPYAHLIINGAKRVENRTWPTSYRGRVLIHAGKSREWLRLNERGTVDASGIALADMQFGAIIGAATLVDCIEPIRYITEPYQRRIPIFKKPDGRRFPWLSQHVHAEGPYCWILDDVVQIEPIPMIGKQGLWEYSEKLPPECFLINNSQPAA